MNTFQSVANQMIADHSDSSDQGTSPDSNSSNNNSTSQALEQERQNTVEAAIAELEKMEKFKFDGQEWTPKDLKGAILRQKDYTQKTQTLSEDRKSFEKEQKFYENLAWDLQKLRDNPQLVQEFISIYPEKFHKFAEEALRESTAQIPDKTEKQVNQPQVPVQLLSRVDRLEKFFTEQETKKNELEISQTMTELAQKYPGTDTERSKRIVLMEAHGRHSAGQKLTPDVWEDIYKKVHEEREAELKAEYGDRVRKQTQANSKARDVGAGGGTAGTAPPKFKKIEDIKHFAINDLTGRGR